MMSPFTHVALTRIPGNEEARKAARRADALPDPAPQPAAVTSPSRVRRSLARLHLRHVRHA